MVPPWPVWRPIPSTFSPSYMPNDRSLYTLYGGLFGLNTNFMIPPMAFHSLVNANNLRLREGIPTTSASFTDNVYPSTSSYRYHPYLTPDKIAAAQKAAESSVAESCRHWCRMMLWNTVVFHITVIIKLVLPGKIYSFKVETDIISYVCFKNQVNQPMILLQKKFEMSSQTIILGFFTLCNFKNVLYVILHIHHAVGLACKLLMTIALSCFIWILMTLQLEWILFNDMYDNLLFLRSVVDSVDLNLLFTCVT